ncbi:MAG: acyl-CoA/acyl-ACP dehydrogenase [Elusimicrobia bacterium]|nr:acyl-CoA/acyl-ACP dehydrogenase [Elusimicrobiota bacterium]
MAFGLSGGQQAVVDACGAMERAFRARAAGYDEAAQFPARNFQDLKKVKLMGMVLPRAWGGLGADFLCYTMALERLARGDASTALNFAQHSIAMGGLAAFDAEGTLGAAARSVSRNSRRFCERIARKQEIVASATSELATGFRPSRARTRFRRSGDRFVLNGEKSFVSMAGHADHYLVAATEEGDTIKPRASYFIVGAKTKGLSVRRNWNSRAMRATVSNDLLLKDCAVSAQALLAGVAGTAVPYLARRPHWAVAGINGVYLGICDSILEFVTGYLSDRRKAGEDRPQSHDPIIQHEVGKLSVALEAARLVVYDAAERVSRKPGDPETNKAVYRAKYLIGETAPQMASDAIRICGGNALRQEFPLERHYRDARAGGLMGAASDVCLTFLGKAEMAIDAASLSETHW